MDRFYGKKLLVLGGFHQHCKVVETAKRLGLTVLVADYYPIERAPAKQIADHAFEIDVFDVDALYRLCKDEKVDGVINVCSDAAQHPYQQLCERLEFPCFGTAEQYRKFSDKRLFKKMCEENGVGVIPGYRPEDFEDEVSARNISFPVFIKPCDSRGSRGQTICYTLAEAKEAIAIARSNSRSGNVIIEQYFGDKPDFSMAYLVVNGKPILIRATDRFLGSKADKMNRSAIGALTPSVYSDLFLQTTAKRIERMILSAGIQNGPIFAQGFVDGNTFRFYDPGLRFPGAEYERQYKSIYGADLMEALIEFAITGSISPKFETLDKTANLRGNFAFTLFVPILPGTIASITGLEEIKAIPGVISVFTDYSVGDTVGAHYNASQRLGEIDFIGSSIESLQDILYKIYDTLTVLDEHGQNMVFSKFDPKLLDNQRFSIDFLCSHSR